MIVLKPSKAVLPVLVKFLKAGQVIAAPTETAYGLLADAANPRAVKNVFKIKNRKSNGKVSALLVADLAVAQKYARFSPLALKLAHRYWPGPLTLVLPAKKKLLPLVVKNKYVGMRVPRHKWLLKLLVKFDKPLTATSANVGGRPAIYSAGAVKKELAKRGLLFLVDAGCLPRRKVSTLAKVVNNKLVILRLGAVSLRSMNQEVGSKNINFKNILNS